MSKTKDFAMFIDELRESRGFTKEDLTEGIVSTRQYHRYVKGDSTLNNHVITALLERLEINTLEVYTRFIRDNDSVYNHLIKIYGLIRTMKYSRAENELNKIIYEEIGSSKNKKFYMLLHYIIQYYCNDDFRNESIESIIELIEYPRILEKNIHTFYELTALFFIADYLIKEKNDYRIPKYTYDVLVSVDKHFVFDNPTFLVAFHASCARYLGKIGEFEKSLEIANIGISKSLKLGFHNSLPNLFLYKAVSEKNLYKKSEYKHTLTRLFSLLKMLNNPSTYSTYSDFIEKRFDIKEEDLIRYK